MIERYPDLYERRVRVEGPNRLPGFGPLSTLNLPVVSRLVRAVHGRKRQFAAPTVHGILAAELLHPAMTAVVTDASLAGREPDGSSVLQPV